LRIVAGLTSSPDERDSVREPTGWPSSRYCAISTRNRWRERASRWAAGLDMRCTRVIVHEYGLWRWNARSGDWMVGRRLGFSFQIAGPRFRMDDRFRAPTTQPHSPFA